MDKDPSISSGKRPRRPRISDRPIVQTQTALWGNIHEPTSSLLTGEERRKRVEQLTKQLNFSSDDLKDIYRYRHYFWTAAKPLVKDDELQQKHLLDKLIHHNQKKELIQHFPHMPEWLRVYLLSKELGWSLKDEDYLDFDLTPSVSFDRHHKSYSMIKNIMKDYAKNLVDEGAWAQISSHWADKFSYYRFEIGWEIIARGKIA
ncbi:MAG: hypothetical protein LBG52_03920 [Candidatus Peribacteria bacterium]|jgi:hypothetical protein|nr:hypothetical protein [Candidatus Peribacteria bacterium]